MNPEINPDVPLGREQYEKALESVAFVREMIALREGDGAYRAHRPGGSWDRERTRGSEWVKFNDFILAHPDYDVVSRLRLFTGAFNGTDLLRDFTFERFLARRGELLGRPNAALYKESLVGPEHLRAYRNWHERLLPPGLRAPTPNILGELGLVRGGVICNRHTLDHFERLSILHECGALAALAERAKGGALSVLEIGAGYGCLAYLLSRALPVRRYLIVDIPESLLFSSIYLPLALPGRPVFQVRGPKADLSADGIHLVPNMFWDELSKPLKDVDLALNTLSFHEMPRSVVEGYADGLRGVFASNAASRPGVLFEQNFENADERSGCNAKRVLRQRFRSEIPRPIYTRQTRGYAELHALDPKVLDELRRRRPAVPLALKLRSRLSPSYLSQRLRQALPPGLKRLVRSAAGPLLPSS